MFWLVVERIRSGLFQTFFVRPLRKPVGLVPLVVIRVISNTIWFAGSTSVTMVPPIGPAAQPQSISVLPLGILLTDPWQLTWMSGTWRNSQTSVAILLTSSRAYSTALEW